MPSLASSLVNAVAKPFFSCLDSLVEVGVVGGELDLLDGDRRLTGEPLGPAEGRVEQLVVGHDAVGEP